MPKVRVLVVGYNNADVTIECLHSLSEGNYPSTVTTYVDNGSEKEELQKVIDAVSDCEVLRIEENDGPAPAFNAGLSHAMAQGDDYVFMLNNDTTVHPDAIGHLVTAAQADSATGMVVPKIFFYDHPDAVWSAGSRYRKFPPSIVMKKILGPDDGRYDSETDLETTSICAALMSRKMLETIGLIDPQYFVLMDDYDMSLRAVDAGFTIHFVPDAHMSHKIGMTREDGNRNSEYWRTYGRSVALFCRKHRHHRWLCSPLHVAYVFLRIAAERKFYGLRPFLKGCREAQSVKINQPPSLSDPLSVTPKVLRSL
jgi:GT2 family glycosyltransferase